MLTHWRLTETQLFYFIYLLHHLHHLHYLQILSQPLPQPFNPYKHFRLYETICISGIFFNTMDSGVWVVVV